MQLLVIDDGVLSYWLCTWASLRGSPTGSNVSQSLRPRQPIHYLHGQLSAHQYMMMRRRSRSRPAALAASSNAFHSGLDFTMPSVVVNS